jgi:O-antigen/teichoic acid export membrane protein
MLGQKSPLAGYIGATFLTKLLSAFLALCASIIVARSLGPTARGQFATAGALSAIGIQIANLGLHSSNTFFLGKNKTLLRALAANSALVAVGLGFIACGTIAIILYVAKPFPDVSFVLIALALLGIPLGLAYMLLQNLLLGMSAFTRFNIIEIGVKVSNVVLVLALFTLGAGDPTNYFVASLLSLFLAVILVWHSLGQPASALKDYSLQLLRDQLPFAFRFYVASLFAFLLLRIDMLMVQHIAGNAQAGYYSIAVGGADMLYLLPAAAGVVLFPRLSGTTSSSARRSITVKMLVHLTWVMILCGIAASWFARGLVTILFGTPFLPAVPMFRILVGATIVYGMNNILSNHLAAEGLPWSAVAIWLVALLINLALNLHWIPGQGGEGAAYASLVAYCVAFGLQLMVFLSFRSVE